MTYRHFRIQLGNRIKEIRNEKGITQEGMEQGRNGVSWRTVQDAEKTEKDVRVGTILRIANRLGVEPLDFFKFGNN